MPLPARTRHLRRSVLALAAGALACGVAACGSTSTPAGVSTLNPAPTVTSPSAAPTDRPTATPKPTPTAKPTPTVHTVPALTCGQLKSAEVGSTTVSYNGYHDSIPLGGLGMWSGEDGNTVTLEKPCGIGDLDGDGAKDAIGEVSLTSGGTGDFYTLVVWHNKNGQPVCVAVADLGDRDPTHSITVSGGQATVVYYTRTDDAPMAELNIERTAIFKLSGSHFTEVSHTDVAGEFNG